MNTNHTGPVSLPAGSYDFDDLKKGLQKAVNGSEAKYGENVSEALKAASDMPHADADPRALPQHRFVEVDNDFGGKETIQVFDPKLPEAEPAGAIPEVHITTSSAIAGGTSKE